jgi:hypothetical protein
MGKDGEILAFIYFDIAGRYKTISCSQFLKYNFKNE